jgi:hypothetical protein
MIDIHAVNSSSSASVVVIQKVLMRSDAKEKDNDPA